MDPEIAEHFATITRLAQESFSQIEYQIDVTPQRVILRLEGRYGLYRLFVTELISGKERQYRYYVLREDWVEAGFDNSPDPRAIRLKYGSIGQEHAGEYIPHLHRSDKTELFLTKEMDFSAFVVWLQKNLLL